MDSQENTVNELNRDSLAEFLKRQYPDRHILFDVRPQMLDELLGQLLIRDYKTISDIKRTLARTTEAVALFEKDHPPSNLEDSQYSGLGIVRLSMLLIDDEFFKSQISVFGDVELRDKLEKYRQYILPEGAIF